MKKPRHIMKILVCFFEIEDNINKWNSFRYNTGTKLKYKFERFDSNWIQPKLDEFVVFSKNYLMQNYAQVYQGWSCHCSSQEKNCNQNKIC